MATKNLGQVAGVAVQNTPPTNIALIWYDNTPSQMCHKVYDTAKKQWVIIDQKIISLITYSEIENLARQSGLPLGKFYQITDRNNTLAVAIASTKVLYADALGNILIDDLGTNIQYHVSSSNLQIDDISGTFNETNSKLVFTFDELENDIDNDYILGKTKRNNIWRLFKFKLQNLISSEQGNAISWNKGLFLNVSKIVYELMDKVGGFVSFETFNKTIETQNTAINNVGKENQNIIQNANKAIADGTSENAIYEKALPKELETGGEPTDIMKGNTLIQCLSKLQRYINKFKYATGIRLSKDFSSSTASGKVNNNDTVETAIAKLSKVSSSAGVLNDYNNTIKGNVQTGDTVEDAFSKVENQIKDVETACKKYTDDELKAACAGVYPAQSEHPSGSSVRINISSSYQEKLAVGDIVQLCAVVYLGVDSHKILTSVEFSFYLDSLTGSKSGGVKTAVGSNSSGNGFATYYITGIFYPDDGYFSLNIAGTSGEMDTTQKNRFIIFKKSRNI